jgi:hypothetical protein
MICVHCAKFKLKFCELYIEAYGQASSHNVVSSTPRHERGSNSQLYWQYYLGTDYTGTVVVNPTTIRSRHFRFVIYMFSCKNLRR